MDLEAALDRVSAAFREGAELRLRVAERCGPAIAEAARVITGCLRDGGKVLLFGNDGSAADAQHLAAEFVGRFVLERRALPAIALTTDSSILTAIGNDYGFDQVLVRQMRALGRPGDVAVGISSSGNSPNVVNAIRVAAEHGLRTIALAGKDGGPLTKVVEIAIVIPSASTARIQECHITVGHVLCELVEGDLFASPPVARAPSLSGGHPHPNLGCHRHRRPQLRSGRLVAQQRGNAECAGQSADVPLYPAVPLAGRGRTRPGQAPRRDCGG